MCFTDKLKAYGKPVSSKSVGPVFLSFFFFLLIYLERERVQGRSRERERKRIPRRLHAVSAEPDAGLEPTNRELMT